jgi:hypothetical protein
MANNRLQIYCVKCKEVKCLAKYYPIDWTVPEDIGKHINEFISQHQKCFESQEDQMWGTDMFKFRTEMDDDGFTNDYREKPYKLIRE